MQGLFLVLYQMVRAEATVTILIRSLHARRLTFRISDYKSGSYSNYIPFMQACYFYSFRNLQWHHRSIYRLSHCLPIQCSQILHCRNANWGCSPQGVLHTQTLPVCNFHLNNAAKGVAQSPWITEGIKYYPAHEDRFTPPWQTLVGIKNINQPIKRCKEKPSSYHSHSYSWIQAVWTSCFIGISIFTVFFLWTRFFEGYTNSYKILFPTFMRYLTPVSQIH